MPKITRKLPEIHIDVGSHNVNPTGGKFSVYLPGDGGFLSHRDKIEWTRATARKYAKEFSVQHGKQAVVVPADATPQEINAMTRHSNPAPRIGTRRPKRVSQATGRAPSKRLVKRRRANVEPGYFPNPAHTMNAPFWIYQHFKGKKEFISASKNQKTADAIAGLLRHHAPSGVTFTVEKAY